MNLKKSIGAVILSSLSVLCFAQDVEVRNGAQFKMGKSNQVINNIIDKSPDNFSFLVNKGKRKFQVMSLDKDLNLDENKEVVLPKVGKKKVKFLSAQQAKDNTYFYSQYFDKKEDKMTMFASELNVKTGQFDQHLEGMAVKHDRFNSFQRPFEVHNSIDSSKVLVVCHYPTKNKEKAAYGLKVVDKDYNEIWANDIVFEQLDKNFTPKEFLVDKAGNVHIVATIRMDRSEKKEKGAASRFYTSIFSYFPETQELKEYEIGFKDEVILSAEVGLNNSGDIICTGFYGYKKMFDAGMKGFFYMRIDPVTKSVTAKNLSAFDKDFLSQLMNERRAKKGKGLNNFVVRDVFTAKDGSMTVVTEMYMHYISYDENGNVQRESWTYGDVAVFFLSPEGKMDKYAVIKKKQYATTNYSLSNALFSEIGISIYPGANEVPYYGIASIMKDGDLYILYNANPKNQGRTAAGKKPRSVRQKNSVTQLVSVAKDGTLASNVLFKSKDKAAGYKMPLMPRYTFQYSNNAMVVIGRKGKKARVSQITIK